MYNVFTPPIMLCYRFAEIIVVMSIHHNTANFHYVLSNAQPIAKPTTVW